MRADCDNTSNAGVASKAWHKLFGGMEARLEYAGGCGKRVLVDPTLIILISTE